MLRPDPAFRWESFASGLEAQGYEVSRQPEASPKPDDVLVLWNRYPQREVIASRYELAGAKVLIAENGYLGREWRGGFWYSLSIGQHNGAGRWPDGEAERWDSWGVELSPWRDDGGETVVLGQRGFGHPSVRSPAGWERVVAKKLGDAGVKARIRQHPGERKAKSIEEDLQDASCVVTWGSGGALKALLMGIPVYHAFARWIGSLASAPFSVPLRQPFRGDRLPMFRRLAWAMWEIEEIAGGEPFRCLLK